MRHIHRELLFSKVAIQHTYSGGGWKYYKVQLFMPYRATVTGGCWRQAKLLSSIMNSYWLYIKCSMRWNALLFSFLISCIFVYQENISNILVEIFDWKSFFEYFCGMSFCTKLFYVEYKHMNWRGLKNFVIW